MAAVEQLVSVRPDEASLRRTSNRIDETVGAPRDVTLDPRRVAAAAKKLGTELDKATKDRSVSLKVLGEEEIRTVTSLVDDLDGRIADISVESDPQELQDVLDLAARINDFTAFVDVDAQDTEVRQLLDLTQQLEQVNAVIAVQASDKSLRDALDFAEKLDQPRTTKVQVEIDKANAERELESFGGATSFRGLKDNLLDRATDAVKGLGRSGGAVLIAAGVAGAAIGKSISLGIERELATDVATARFLLDPAEAEQAGRVGGQVYARGFGESLQETVATTASLDRAFQGLTLSATDNLQDLTAQTLTLARVQEQDLVQTARAAAAIYRNELAPSAEAALDNITFLFARGGPAAEDALDTFSEYANQIRDAGLNAEEFTALLVTGLNNGARASDGVADSVKELNLRITEGNEATRIELNKLGIDYQDTLDLLDDNRGFDAIQNISRALGDVQNRSEQVRIAQILLGGTYEQTGIEALLAFADADQQLLEIEGSSKRAADALENNTATAVESFRRSWEKELGEFGEALIGTIAGDTAADLEGESRDLGRKLGESIADAIVAGFESRNAGEGQGQGAIRGGLGGFFEGLFPSGSNEAAGAEVARDFRTGFGTVFDSVGELFGGGGQVDENGDIQNAFDRALDTEQIESGFGRTLRAAGALNNEIDGSDRRLLNAAQAARELEEETEAAADAADRGARSYEQLTDDIENTADALRGTFQFGTDELFRDALEQAQEFRDELGDLSDVDVDPFGGIDISNEAGFALQETLEQASRIRSGFVDEIEAGNATFAQADAALGGLAESFREAATAAGLSGDEVDDLVEKYFGLSQAAAVTLRADVDARAFNAFENQVASLDQGFALSVGLDLQDEEVLRAAFEAQQVFQQQAPAFQVRVDVDENGIADATELRGLFGDLVQGSELPITFDFDDDGTTELEEIQEAFDGAEFLSDIGFDVDFNGLVSAEERSSAFGVLQAFATLGYDVDDDGEVRANDIGERFELEEFFADVGYRVNDAGILEARNSAEDYAAADFGTLIGADPSAALTVFDEIEERGETLADTGYEVTVRADDRATAEIDRIVRDRTVTVRVRTSTTGAGGGNVPTNIFGRGGIIESDGTIRRMSGGGIFDGIVNPRAGGVAGVFNGQRFIAAENGGSELMINSRAPLSRNLDLIEAFNGGQLARDLAAAYGGANQGGQIVNHWSVATPIQDPVMGTQHVLRQIEQLSASAVRSERARNRRTWRPQ